jgi:hypothetical protein
MAGTDKFLFDLLSGFHLPVGVLTDQNTYSVIIKTPIVLLVKTPTDKKSILLVLSSNLIKHKRDACAIIRCRIRIATGAGLPTCVASLLVFSTLRI